MIDHTKLHDEYVKAGIAISGVNYDGSPIFLVQEEAIGPLGVPMVGWVQKSTEHLSANDKKKAKDVLDAHKKERSKGAV